MKCRVILYYRHQSSIQCWALDAGVKFNMAQDPIVTYWGQAPDAAVASLSVATQAWYKTIHVGTGFKVFHLGHDWNTEHQVIESIVMTLCH